MEYAKEFSPWDMINIRKFIDLMKKEITPDDEYSDSVVNSVFEILYAKLDVIEHIVDSEYESYARKANAEKS